MNNSVVELKNYRWQGVDSRGRHCRGYELALNSTQVRDKLNQQKIRITQLRAKKVSSIRQYVERVKAKDLSLFTRQLATMLATNLPLLQALKLIRENQTKVSMKLLLHGMTADIEAGLPIAKAFGNSQLFNDLCIDLIACGEVSGKLTEVFQRLAEHQEKSLQLKKQLLKASIYPSLVLIISLAVIYLMLTLVIPQFETLFASFGSQLPWFTQQVLTVSDFASAYGLVCFITLIALVMAIRALRRHSRRFALSLSRFILHLPIVGKVIAKSFIARFSRTLAISVSSGLPLLTSLKTAKQSNYPLCYHKALADIYTDTSSGMPLSLAMRRSGAFCEMALQMVMIGEESGRLDDMLNRIATMYETEIDDLVEQFGQLIEPLVIVLLSVIVGSLVLAIYLPIFNLMNVMG